mmetsp:Transcript_14755/g.22371  ORF Transcript_14755/g.22371 Transcript_14755/m.22371 type:complete len:337 (+) Transcript_14755:59-1069(+)
MQVQPGGSELKVEESPQQQNEIPLVNTLDPTEPESPAGELSPDAKAAKKAAKAYPEAEPSNNVYLWGIPSTFTDSDLSLLVFACGNVVSVRMGPPTSKPHTYAFAQFNKQEEAQKAIELLNSRKLNSRELVVRFAKPPPQTNKHKSKKMNSPVQHMYNTYTHMGAMGYDDRKNAHFGPYAPMELYHLPPYQTTTNNGTQPPMVNVNMPQGSGMGMNGMAPVPNIYPPSHQMRALHISKPATGGGKAATLSTTNIYISGLPKDVNDKSLEDLFGSYGKVVSTKVIMNRHTGTPLGTALVRMETNQQAASCIENLNGFRLEGGYMLSCRFANEKKRRE